MNFKIETCVKCTWVSLIHKMKLSRLNLTSWLSTKLLKQSRNGEEQKQLLLQTLCCRYYEFHKKVSSEIPDNDNKVIWLT